MAMGMVSELACRMKPIHVICKASPGTRSLGPGLTVGGWVDVMDEETIFE